MAKVYKATGINNLDLHVETGTYYARIKKNGNTIRHAVGNDKKTAIKLKNKWVEEQQGKNSGVDGTLGSLVEPYYIWLNGERALKHIEESTENYKHELVTAIRNTWQDFDRKRISKLEKSDLRNFQLEMIENYSPTRVNGSITAVREMLDRAVEKKMITKADRDTLLEDLKYVKVKLDYKRLLAHLPEHPVLIKLREKVHRRCKNRGELGHWLFDFLLCSGCRIESANEAMWEDVDWKRDELYFRKAKYGPYTIPLFPDLRECLEGLKAVTGGKPGTHILPTKSIQTVLTGACVEIGTPHLSHHDLRHLFATKAIEEGKDILTVAGWLGHKDNGRTVLMIYGHLRRGHSHAEAKTMRSLNGVEKPVSQSYEI